MKRIEEELRIIREQMEEDFLLHSERIRSQHQSVAKIEQALGRVEDALGLVSREFRDYAHTTRSYHDTWTTERKRNLRLLDVIQTGLLTGGLDTDARLERIERRLTRLEENQSGAA